MNHDEELEHAQVVTLRPVPPGNYAACPVCGVDGDKPCWLAVHSGNWYNHKERTAGSLLRTAECGNLVPITGFRPGYDLAQCPVCQADPGEECWLAVGSGR